MRWQDGRIILDKFPETEEEVAMATQILAEDFDKMSLEEREQVIFDIHGLDQKNNDDPSDVGSYLDCLEEEILKAPQKSSYGRAKYYNEDFVTNREFLLMFLRSERFDTKMAAERLMKHFEVKENLFGSNEILGRDVRLSDLSEEDMRVLGSGHVQVLPNRDLAGRSVILTADMYRPADCSTINVTRTFWYMLNTTLRDEETQKKGIVVVAYHVDPQPREDHMKEVRTMDELVSGIPKKLMGVHLCYSDESLRPYVTGLNLFLDKEVRQHFRSHFGENTDFVLSTYGIPTNEQPMNSHGELSLAWHTEWLNVRRTQEASEGMSNGVIVPRRFDVLFGRGKHTREHTGNLRAYHIVEVFRREYESAAKFEKTVIADRIVAIIHESLGRFLKWDNQGWVEVSDAVAREKISHFFRFLRGKQPLSTEQAQVRANEGCSAKRVTPPPDHAADPSSRKQPCFYNHDVEAWPC